MAICCFFLMIRRPPRSTLDRSSAASDVYKRQLEGSAGEEDADQLARFRGHRHLTEEARLDAVPVAVSYTHLRAHETVLDLVCRLLLEKKQTAPPHSKLLSGTKMTQRLTSMARNTD